LRTASATFCLLLLAHFSAAQQVLTESDAQQHLMQHSEPLYPPIAQAARVQGNVEIAIVIDATGKVTSEKVVSGPPMLRQSALDAVKEWQFKPFENNGAVIQTSTTLTIPFHLEKRAQEPSVEQAKAAQAWFPLSDKCRSSLKAQNTQDSLDYCKQALDMSIKAGDLTSSDQLAMLESHQAYGHALLTAGKFQEALAEEDKAIDVAKAHLNNTDQEYAMPFYWRAMVKEALGQGDSASTDLTAAEETHRKAIKHLPEAKEMYSRYLASILKQHAALLDQMGRPAEAAKLRAEAASL
jgi:TonB family protein